MLKVDKLHFVGLLRIILIIFLFLMLVFSTYSGSSNVTLSKEEGHFAANPEQNVQSAEEFILNNSFPVTGAEVSPISGVQTHMLKGKEKLS